MANVLNVSSQALSVVSSLATLYFYLKGTVVNVPSSQSMVDFFPGGATIPVALLFGALAIYFIMKTIKERKK